jgi:hypothetical protein
MVERRHRVQDAKPPDPARDIYRRASHHNGPGAYLDVATDDCRWMNSGQEWEVWAIGGDIGCHPRPDCVVTDCNQATLQSVRLDQAR